jgi:hypothetical protein
MYKVESVELPQAKGKKSIYPFKTLEVGESFFIFCESEQMTKTQRKMSALCVMSGKRHGKKFVTRRVDNGVRIFRIEKEEKS